MASVTQRIKQIKQPRGGYLNISDFDVISLDDGKELSKNENISPAMVGLVVDYMSRFLNGAPVEDAFKVSLLGAIMAKEVAKASILLSHIKDLSDESIISAAKLVTYDTVTRQGLIYFHGFSHINPNKETIENIRIMVARALTFFKEYGPITVDGFTFEGGYTRTVNTGDGDFLTKDTLFDFKVSIKEPTSSHTLQLLMYYIMGKHSIHEHFDSIFNLGIFNPRLNKVYLYDVTNLKTSVIEAVENEVICYNT